MQGSALCVRRNPWRSPRSALQASLSKHPTPAERYRTQLAPLPPLFPLDRKPRMAPYKAASVVVEHSTLAKHGLIDTLLANAARQNLADAAALS